MDPLSIISGIIAVGQVTATVTKYADILYQVSYKAGTMAEDVEFFASQINVFGSTISSVYNTIRGHYEKDNNSMVLQRLHKYTTLRNLADLSKHLMRRVKKLQPRAKSQQTSRGIWQGLRWYMKKEERKDICLLMDRVQLSFLLIMHQVTYEALQQQASRPFSADNEVWDFRREMKQHRRLMRTHMRSILVWKDRYENFKRREYHGDEESHNLAFHKIEKTILDLGKSMVTDQPSPLSTVLSANTGSSSSNGGRPYDGWGDYHSVNLVGREDLASHQSLPQSPSSESESSETPPGHDVTLQPRAGPLDRLQTRMPESIPTSRSTPEDPGPAEPRVWAEGDYLAVQAFDSLLHLDPDLNSEILQGYINSNAEPTSAILNHEFPQNVISQTHAVQLGLDIDFFHDEDHAENETMDRLDVKEGTEIDFGDGSLELVIGMVTFVWKNSRESTHLRPLKVNCLVCQYVPFPSPLIFGKSFFEKWSHYRRRIAP